MNPVTLSQHLQALAADDFLEALKADFDAESKSQSHDPTWKARAKAHPIREHLDKLYMRTSVNGAHPNRVSAFFLGMQVGFGGFADLATGLAEKGEPALSEAVNRLDYGQFTADLPQLQLVTLKHLPDWLATYPAFHMGFRISCFYHRRARTQLVACLSLYDGLFAMTSWVTLGVLRQDGKPGLSP